VEVTIEAALAGSLLLNSAPRYLKPDSSLMASSKPCWRWSVVEIPGLTFTTMTGAGSGISSTNVSAATRPDSRLSVAISDSARSASITVSTRITLIPASTACWIGAIIALTSVGAIRMASGLRATTLFTIGVCCAASNSSGPWTSSLTFALLAASRAPQAIVT
jgi:hypothetical protein